MGITNKGLAMIHKILFNNVQRHSCNPGLKIPHNKVQEISNFWPAKVLIGLCLPLLMLHPPEAGGTPQNTNIQKKSASAQNKITAPKTAVSPDQNANEKPLPKFFSGKVVNHDLKPVAAALIQVNIGLVNRGNAKRSIKLKAITDENGEYSIPTGHLRTTGKQILVGCIVQSTDYPKTSFGWVYKTIPNKFRYTTTKFYKPRIITGRIVGSFQKDGKTIRPNRAWINAACSYDFQKRNSWGSGSFRCNDDGSFRIIAPYDFYAELVIRDRNFAGKRIPLSTAVPFGKKSLDLGDIELERGTIVSGILSDQDRQPISGAVIGISDLESSQLDGVHLGNEWFCRTNEKGEFLFPPFAGKCEIQLTDSGNNPDGSEFKSSLKDPPLVKSVSVNLGSNAGSKTVKLTTVPTITISGYVKWPDGKPVPDVTIWGSDSDGTSVEKTTDRNGKYQIELAKKAATKRVSVLDHQTPDGNAFFPVLSPTFPAPASHNGQTHLKNIHNDKTGLDWVMIKNYRTPGGIDNSESSKQYQILCEDFKLERNRFRRELGTLGLEERPGFIKRSDPSFRHIQNLLNHEKKYRGEPGGFDALGAVILACAKSNRDTPHQAFFLVAKKRLERHYKNNTRILQLLADVGATSLIDFGSKNDLLIAVYGSSENKEIKTEAIFQLMRIMVCSYGHSNRQIHTANHRQIITSSNRLIRGYANLAKKIGGKRIRRVSRANPFIHSFRLGVRWTGYINANSNPVSYESLVDAALRDCFELQPGKPFPNLSGTGFDGKKYSLADQKGKLVVVVAGGSPYSPVNRERIKYLRKTYGPNDLDSFLISTEGTFGEFYSTLRDIKSEKITGTVINDTTKRENTYYLNNFDYADHYYLIDPKGKLLCRAINMGAIEQKVQEILGSK